MSNSINEGGWPCWYGTDASEQNVLLVNLDDGTQSAVLYLDNAEAEEVVAKLPGYKSAKLATLAELVAFLERMKKLGVPNAGFMKSGQMLPRRTASVLLDARLALE